MASSRVSALTAPLPWYETLPSLLDGDHPFWHSRRMYIGESVGLSLAANDQRPHRPPQGQCSFFVGQMEGGLRLPIPPAYLALSRFYGIALNQFSPNAFRILAGTVVVFQHLGLSLTPTLFHCLFQLKTSDTGVFYFSARPDCQFLRGMPSSHKGWKSLYFFAALPDPLPCSEAWRLDLPDLPAISGCRQECGFESVARVLQDHNYNVNYLVEHRLLGFLGLSPFIPEEAVLIGMLFPSPCCFSATSNVIPSISDDLMQRAMVSALHLQESAGSKRKREAPSSPIARRSLRKKKVAPALTVTPILSLEGQLAPMPVESAPRDPSPGSSSSDGTPLVIRRYQPPLSLPAPGDSPPPPPPLRPNASSPIGEEENSQAPASAAFTSGNPDLDALLSPPPEAERAFRLASQALLTRGKRRLSKVG